MQDANTAAKEASADEAVTVLGVTDEKTEREGIPRSRGVRTNFGSGLSWNEFSRPEVGIV
ncbi:MAG: hypothetical protein O3B24_06745 [Verrucomicrobia bacterium]|nr:hypothetical protein [Verrucomicrobiota bacterium]